MNMTLEQKPEERDKAGPVDAWVKNVPDRGNSQCEGHEAACAWTVSETRRRSV